ncbi:MAG TPA: hypothetical protein VFY50_00460 [Candidatus Nitrosocosmicus sp.]|nr:hypothetical protein [Candidatus Nitrosocosmicus sp.]
MTITNSRSHRVDNLILVELNGIMVGRKYYSSIPSENTHIEHALNILNRLYGKRTIC